MGLEWFGRGSGVVGLVAYDGIFRFPKWFYELSMMKGYDEVEAESISKRRKYIYSESINMGYSFYIFIDET